MANKTVMTFDKRKALRSLQYGPSNLELQMAAATEAQIKKKMNEEIFLNHFSTYNSKMIALLQAKGTDEGTDQGTDQGTDEGKLRTLFFKIIKKDKVSISDINNLVGYFFRNLEDALILEIYLINNISYREIFEDIFYMLKLKFIKFYDIPEAEVRCETSQIKFKHVIYCLCFIFNRVLQSK